MQGRHLNSDESEMKEQVRSALARQPPTPTPPLLQPILAHSSNFHDSELQHVGASKKKKKKERKKCGFRRESRDAHLIKFFLLFFNFPLLSIPVRSGLEYVPQ